MPAVRSLRRPVRAALSAAAAGAGLALALAACGSSAPASRASAPSGSVSAASAGKGAEVQVVERKGFGKILADSAGFTLYHHTPDTSTKSACTGECAVMWPPLLLPSAAAAPTGGAGVSGLATVARSDGARQVTYHGMPLYTYSGDSSAGQVNGQGMDGVWFVVSAGTSGSSTTTTSSIPSYAGY